MSGNPKAPDRDGSTANSSSSPPRNAPAGKGPPKKRKKRRLLRAVILLFILLAIVIAGLPWIVSTSTVTGWTMSLASSFIRGEIVVDDLHVGWSGPIYVEGLQVLDPQGEETLTVTRAECETGLWGLVRNYAAFGHVEIDSVEAILAFDEENRISLLEAFELVSPSEKTESEGPLPALEGKVVLKDATITVIRPGRAPYTVTDFNGQVELQTLNQLDATLAANFPDGARFTAEGNINDLFAGDTFSPSAASGSVKLGTDKATEIGSLLDVIADQDGYAGTVLLEGEATFAGDDTTGQVSLTVAGLQRRVAGTSGVAPLDAMATSTFTLKKDVLDLDADLKGALGSAGLKTNYPLTAALPDLTAEKLLSAVLAGEKLDLPEATLNVQAEFDVAAIDRAIPGLLNLREDQRLTSGRLVISDTSLRGGNEPALQANLRLADFRAQTGDKTVSIQPVSVASRWRLVSGRGLHVENLNLTSSFAGATAEGWASELESVFNIDLSAMQNELGQMFDFGEMQLGGRIDGSLEVARADDQTLTMTLRVQCPELRYTAGADTTRIEQFTLHQDGRILMDGQRVTRYVSKGDLQGRGIHVNGKQAVPGGIRLTWADLACEMAGGKLLLAKADMQAGGVTLNAEDLAVALDAGDLEKGRLRCDAELAELLTIINNLTGGDAPPEIKGKLTLASNLSSAGRRLRLETDGTITGLEIGSGTQVVREDKVTMNLSAEVDQANHILTLSKASVQSRPLAVDLSGKVEQTDTLMDTAITGNYTASWSELTTLLHELSPATRELVQIRGNTKYDLRLKGPLSDPKVKPGFRHATAEAALGWDAAQLMGVDVGKATIKPQLADAVITIPQTTIDAVRGKVRLGGHIDLKPDEPLLQMPGQNRVLDGVQITPDLSRQLLSRINPVFYFVADAEGTIHLDINDLRLPLGDTLLTQGQGHGRVDLVNMRAQPSGWLSELLVMGNVVREREMLTIQLQGGTFRIVEGRIRYEDFTLLLAGDFDLNFSGSVGLDETLDLLVSMPIRAELLRRLGVRSTAEEYARMLEGTRIQVPLTGTRTRPSLDFSKVDTDALLKDVVKKGVEGKARDLLRGFLE